jgi:predicted metal-dependent peptidase
MSNNAAQADGSALYVHRGTRAVQRMVEYAPSTGGLALWVRHRDLPTQAVADAPTIATDGNTIFYGAAFERLPVAEQSGLVAHEVLHIALRHPQRFVDLQRLLGDVDLQIFNICADALINSTLSHLGWLQLPASSVSLDRLLMSVLGIDQAVDKSLLEWDVERLYRAIDDRRPPPAGGRRRAPQRREGGDDADAPGGRAAPNPQADGDEAMPRPDGPRSERVRALGSETERDLVPGPDTRGPPEEEADQAREWSERILRGHTNDGAHSMLRALIADLPRVRTPWEQVLRTQLARSLSPKRDLSWSRPSRSWIANQGRIGPGRRLPWEPGFSASRSVPRLAVIVDVSGSIDDALMERFAREIEAISRRLEAGLVLIVGDDRVQRVAHFAPGRADLQGITFSGGGGTDFTPLLLEADAHHPDIAVVLTDLDGPARFRPRWPVLWAVPEAARSALPPFGRKLVLD